MKTAFLTSIPEISGLSLEIIQKLENMKRKCYSIERDVLDWLVEQMDSDEIEEVTDEILDSLIEKHTAILAVFCKNISDNMKRLEIHTKKVVIRIYLQ